MHGHESHRYHASRQMGGKETINNQNDVSTVLPAYLPAQVFTITVRMTHKLVIQRDRSAGVLSHFLCIIYN